MYAQQPPSSESMVSDKCISFGGVVSNTSTRCYFVCQAVINVHIWTSTHPLLPNSAITWCNHVIIWRHRLGWTLSQALTYRPLVPGHYVTRLFTVCNICWDVYQCILFTGQRIREFVTCNNEYIKNVADENRGKMLNNDGLTVLSLFWLLSHHTSGKFLELP